MGISLSSFCHWLLFLFILCPSHAGCLAAAELVHFSKALGHSWTIFAQKIGYEAEELKVAGSSKLSKKTFFAKIWLVPKFDDDQVKKLLCELLTAIPDLDYVLRNFRYRLSRGESSRHGISALDTSTSTFTMSLLDGSEGSRSESDMASTDTEFETETETETETPSESKGERAKKDVSAAVVGQNCDSLGAKAASQSNSGLVSAPNTSKAHAVSTFMQSSLLNHMMLSVITVRRPVCCAYFLYCFGVMFVCCYDTVELFGSLSSAHSLHESVLPCVCTLVYHLILTNSVAWMMALP